MKKFMSVLVVMLISVLTSLSQPVLQISNVNLRVLNHDTLIYNPIIEQWVLRHLPDSIYFTVKNVGDQPTNYNPLSRIIFSEVPNIDNEEQNDWLWIDQMTSVLEPNEEINFEVAIQQLTQPYFSSYDYLFIYTTDIQNPGVEDLVMLQVSTYENSSPTNIILTTNKLNIYPNPVKDYLNIDYDNIKSINIYDLTGRLILNTTDNKIDVSDFVLGTYIIRVNDEATKIFIKE